MALGFVCKKLADNVVGVKIASPNFVDTAAQSVQNLRVKTIEAQQTAVALETKATVEAKKAEVLSKEAALSAKGAAVAASKGDESAVKRLLNETAKKGEAATVAATNAKVATVSADAARKMASTLDLATKATINKKPEEVKQALTAAQNLVGQTAIVQVSAKQLPLAIGKDAVKAQVATVANKMQAQGVIGPNQAAITKGLTLKGLAGLAGNLAGDASAATSTPPTDYLAEFNKTVKSATEVLDLLGKVTGFFTGDWIAQSGPERDAYVKKAYAAVYNGVEPTATALANINKAYSWCRGRPCVSKENIAALIRANPPTPQQVIEWYKRTHPSSSGSSNYMTVGAGTDLTSFVPTPVLIGLGVLAVGGIAFFALRK